MLIGQRFSMGLKGVLEMATNVFAGEADGPLDFGLGGRGDVDGCGLTRCAGGASSERLNGCP